MFWCITILTFFPISTSWRKKKKKNIFLSILKSMSAKPSKIYFRAQQGKKPSTGERSELRRNGWPRSGIGMAGMNKKFWRPRRTDDQKWHDFIWGFPKVFHIFAILSFFLVYSFWNFVKNLHVVFYWKFPKLFFFSPKHFATPKNARASPFDGSDFLETVFRHGWLHFDPKNVIFNFGAYEYFSAQWWVIEFLETIK